MCGSSQDCAYASKQFVRKERLGKVVVSSHFQPRDSVVLIRLGAEDEDWNLRIAPNPPQQLKSVDPRKECVGNDQIVAARFGTNHASLAVQFKVGVIP